MKVRIASIRSGTEVRGAGRIPSGDDGRAAVTSQQRSLMWPEQADSLAADLLGKLRTTLGGLREITHARRVAAAVLSAGDSRVTCAALLHDVLEKTEITVDDLLARTGDVEVVRLVDILTRRNSDSDTEYLTRCAADPLTLLVKRADLADKLVADDTIVPDAAAEQIRNQAKERLLLLDLLATQTRD